MQNGHQERFQLPFAATASEDLEGDLNDGDEWLLQLDDDQGNDVLETIALRALGFAESMSGDGSRGPYDGTPGTKDYFATLLQQPDERFRYVFTMLSGQYL